MNKYEIVNELAKNKTVEKMLTHFSTINKADLSQNIYYTGEQDDDDFEKLVLDPKTFDLKLIKRIVEVNGTSVPERIKSVDVSKLNTIGSDGKKITTATKIETTNKGIRFVI